MNILKLDERLSRIEKLLLSKKKVLTLEEASEYSGYAKGYLYKLTSAGDIPFSKPNGKNIFFDKDRLDNWLLQNESKSSQELEEEAFNYTMKHRR
jgi:excisionase family DNA binding protein